LDYACWSDNKDMARLLLDNHAEVNMADEYGDTPFHITANRGHEKISKLLLERGANPGLKNQSGKTAHELGWRGITCKMSALNSILTNDAKRKADLFYVRVVNLSGYWARDKRDLVPWPQEIELFPNIQELDLSENPKLVPYIPALEGKWVGLTHLALRKNNLARY
jgi:ankyrin repeat protein